MPVHRGGGAPALPRIDHRSPPVVSACRLCLRPSHRRCRRRCGRRRSSRGRGRRCRKAPGRRGRRGRAARVTPPKPSATVTWSGLNACPIRPTKKRPDGSGTNVTSSDRSAMKPIRSVRASRVTGWRLASSTNTRVRPESPSATISRRSSPTIWIGPPWGPTVCSGSLASAVSPALPLPKGEGGSRFFRQSPSSFGRGRLGVRAARATRGLRPAWSWPSPPPRSSYASSRPCRRPRSDTPASARTWR